MFLPYTVTNKLETDKIVETIPKVAGTLKRASNITIDGSSQDGDGGDTGGGTDTPTPNPGDDTEKSKLTFTVDAEGRPIYYVDASFTE